jgi:hypothetical protein
MNGSDGVSILLSVSCVSLGVFFLVSALGKLLAWQAFM